MSDQIEIGIRIRSKLIEALNSETKGNDVKAGIIFSSIIDFASHITDEIEDMTDFSEQVYRENRLHLVKIFEKELMRKYE